VTRGDIHEVRLGQATGHEHGGRRYGVIVQSDVFDGLSTVIVAPTSTQAVATSWRPEIALGGRVTRILVEQTKVIDRRRVGRRVGRLSTEETWELDDALRAMLGLG